MWKKCELNGIEHLIKHTVNEALHKLYITDLISLWCEEITEDSLLRRCKEMNKLLEASEEVLLSLVWSLVEGEGDDVITGFTDINSVKQLNLQSNLDGFKFRIKFMLRLAGPIQFFEEVSCPLLMTITELEKRQKYLVDVIKKKDLEIAEYKLEGAKISRKAVETEVFDLEKFSNNCLKDLGTSKGLVQTRPSHTFTSFITELLGNITTAVATTPESNHDGLSGVSQIRKKMGPIKLKSPVKSKKAKIYDDEDDEINEKEKIKKEVEDSVTENCSQKKEAKVKPTKGNQRPKVKKALLNL